MIKKLKLSTKCMPEARFWKLVELANWPCDYNRMRMVYRKMLSKKECESFRYTLDKAYGALSDVADTIENLPVGDDSYGDLRYHIIGLGEKRFYEYCNDKLMIQELAESGGYKESFGYCIPYDGDYSKDNVYTIKHVIDVANDSKEEIDRFWKMDVGTSAWRQWNHLKPVGMEITLIKNIIDLFLKEIKTNQAFALSRLVAEKKYIDKAVAKIDKFFEDNYKKLPRKFTDEDDKGRDSRGMCTTLFVNLVLDAETVQEFMEKGN